MIKFKPKQLLKRLATSAVALITAASLAVQSFALDDPNGDGDPTGAKYGSDYLYSWYSYKCARWMVEAYVSTTADGKIDVTKESLGGNNDGQLARIGAILFYSGENNLLTDDVILPAGTTTNLERV